jgi:hypothetical protein
VVEEEDEEEGGGKGKKKGKAAKGKQAPEPQEEQVKRQGHRRHSRQETTPMRAKRQGQATTWKPRAGRLAG